MKKTLLAAAFVSGAAVGSIVDMTGTVWAAQTELKAVQVDACLTTQQAVKVNSFITGQVCPVVNKANELTGEHACKANHIEGLRFSRDNYGCKSGWKLDGIAKIPYLLMPAKFEDIK